MVLTKTQSDRFSYLGNRNLKKPNAIIEFTQHQIDEYDKCSKDPIYFARNYMKIVNVDRGLIPFEMYDYQEDTIQTFKDNRFCILKFPRQTGKSTCVVAYMLWLVLFKDMYSIAILANKARLAAELLGRLELAYEHLPKWLQQGVVVWNKRSIELENGSKIMAEATTASAVRGGSFNMIFLDEFAHIRTNLAEEFFQSVYPTISSGKTTQVIIVSTPNGMNHYYKMWTNAKQGRSEYVPLEIHWSQVPGRDEQWKRQQINNTSEQQFSQEFECQFLGSTHTLVSPQTLQQMTFVTPISSKHSFDQYYNVIEDHTYVIVADVSRGKELDYSAFIVYDITEYPYRIAAKYNNNAVSPLVYPEIIYQIANYYNQAYILVETNDIGQQVADIIANDYEYENIISTATSGNKGIVAKAWASNHTQLGVRTTKLVKRIGCATIKDVIETSKLIIEDFEIIEQLTTFTLQKNTYKADEGCYDDLVMCLVLFGWLIRQDFFKELTNSDFRAKMLLQQKHYLEQEVMPFGFMHDDGREAYEEIVDGSSFKLPSHYWWEEQ
jgi:hypothetical protein